jgi:hypothetical protein
MSKRKRRSRKARAHTKDVRDNDHQGHVSSESRRVKLGAGIEAEVAYYPVEKDLSEKIRLLARKRGVSANTLVNIWLAQKIREHGDIELDADDS